MATGTMKVSRRACGQCGTSGKCEKNARVWGLGDFVMILATCGGWLALRLVFDALANPYRCSTCGTKV